MRRILRRFHADDRAQALVLFILLTPILAMASGFVVDSGNLYLNAMQLQSMADSSALAGAHAFVRGEDPAVKAADYVSANGAVTAQDIDDDYSPCGGVRCIRVEVRRDLPKLFIQMFYHGEWYARKYAIATVSGGTSPYALMAMDETACKALDLNGNNATITITGGGGSYVRSECSNALDLSGNGNLVSSQNDVRGGWSLGANALVTPATPTKKGWLPDPFLDLAPPFLNKPCWTGDYNFTGNTTVTLSPDYAYCNELKVTANANVILIPGVYVLRAGMTISGNGDVTVQNDGEVLIYNTCASSPCNGSTPGAVDISGNGVVDLTGSSSYEHLVLWNDRTASNSASIKLCGNAAGSQDGIIYAVTTQVKLCGNGDATYQIVARTVTNDGNTNLTIAYNSSIAPTIYTTALTR